MNALQKSIAQEQVARVNRRMPAYPATIVLFSRVVGNTAYEVITVTNQEDYDTLRTFTVAAIRVVSTADDLTDLPTATLLRMYNDVTAGAPGTQFPAGGDPRELVFGILPKLSTPYEDSTMADQTEAKTSAEAKALEKKAAREKKAAEKEAAKAARAEKHADGVIGNIKKALETKAGVTVEEMLDQLVTKFPDRTRDGMKSTVKIQFSRLQKSTGREIHNANIEGRGRVYKFVDAGPVPGKVVAPAAKAETPAEAKAPAAAPTPAATPAAEPATPKRRPGGKK